MARGNKNLEWTMIDADMKSSYLKDGKVRYTKWQED